MGRDEWEAHLRHGVLFNDFEKRAECLCGKRIAYGDFEWDWCETRGPIQEVAEAMERSFG